MYEIILYIKYITIDMRVFYILGKNNNSTRAGRNLTELHYGLGGVGWGGMKNPSGLANFVIGWNKHETTNTVIK